VEETLRTAAAVQLTARGAKTRRRIVTTAAEMMHVRGVGATTLDDIVAAGGLSKSQFYRHFPDKAALVREVIEYVGDRTIGGERERLGSVRTVAGLRRWRDAIIANNALRHGQYGCPLGSLANEVADQDGAARHMLEELFAAWGMLFRDMLVRFQEDHLIPESANVERLAVSLLAAVQGGYLLAQTAHNVEPMATAIDVAIEHLVLIARTSEPALDPQ
jgi:TetR/AcrR family transcriptional repressor of nem operon